MTIDDAVELSDWKTKFIRVRAYLLCFFLRGRGGGFPVSGLGPLRAVADLWAGSIKFDGDVDDTCRAE